MDKELLFQFMRTRFREAGFSEQEVTLHLSRFQDRYEGKSDDEIEADIMTHGGPSKVVAHVIERRNAVFIKDPDYRAFAEKPYHPEEEEHTAAPEEDDDVKPYTPAKETAQDQPGPEKEKAPENDILSWFSDDSRSLSGHAAADDVLPQVGSRPKPYGEYRSSGTASPRAETPEEPRGETAAVQSPAAKPAQQEGDMSRTRVITVSQNAGQQPHAAPAAPEAITDPSAHRPAAPRTQTPQNRQNGVQKKAAKSGGKAQKSGGRRTASRLSEITYWGEGTEEGYRRFWILFAVTLPITVCLLLVLILIAAAVIAAIVGGIVGLILLLIAEVAVGAAISLIGIIYGVSQLFLTLPVGLFELGIGVCAVGATMFAGIILYNLAVRFLPFVLKQFLRFVRFFRAFLEDLYYYLKGECYRR